MEYRIKQVSDRLQIPVSTIRFWQNEFPRFVRPARTNGGQRRYSELDVAALQRIKVLVYDRKKSIEESRLILEHGEESPNKIDWSNQSILITGGTGSFGKHFCKIMLEKYNPRVIRVYSRDELKQHEMRQKFGEEKLRYFIGDVRDGNRLRRAMEGVDIVIHAAALKQVPACEYNPLEAVKTNVHGAQNILDAAIDARVKKVMALSTDKAVNPVNLYGATKLCAEKIIVQGNAYAKPKGSTFSCVRYGNVIGSRGSVIPLFLKQKETGRITVTDQRMTRFWLTLDQAVELVVKGLTHMDGGEIFIPIIPSMRIMDLAKAVAPDCKVDVIGIRPGEKLHEALTTEEDGRHMVEYDGMYIVLPNFPWWETKNYHEAKKLPEDFIYTSDTNHWWMSVEELKEIVYGASESQIERRGVLV